MDRYLETDRGTKEYIHGNWVRHEDAQSRIAELEAEVERLHNLVTSKVAEGVISDWLERDEYDTAWNDAIDAAYTATVIWMHNEDDDRDAHQLFADLRRQ